MPEPVVADPPAKETPTVGAKYREAFAKLEGTQPKPAKAAEPPEPKKEDTPPAEPTKEEKPVSPLDIAAGTAKPPEKKTPDDTEWEKEEVLKEFDKNKANWAEARKKMGLQSLTVKQLNAEIERLKQETSKTDPKTVEELAAARKEKDELAGKLKEREEAIKAINAEYSDEYRALVGSRQNAVTKAATRLKAYGGDSEALIEAMQLPEGKVKSAHIKEILSELEPEDKTRVLTLIENVGEVDDKIAEFRKDLPSKWDEIQKKRDDLLREESEKNARALTTNFEKVARVLPDKSPFLREIDGDISGASDWNSAVKSAKENGLRIMNGTGVSFEESVAVAVKGSDYDRVSNLLLDTRKELAEANKRLAEFDRGGPDFKGGKKPQTTEKLSPSEKYKKAMAAIQGSGSEE